MDYNTELPCDLRRLTRKDLAIMNVLLRHIAFSTIAIISLGFALTGCSSLNASRLGGPQNKAVGTWTGALTDRLILQPGGACQWSVGPCSWTKTNDPNTINIKKSIYDGGYRYTDTSGLFTIGDDPKSAELVLANGTVVQYHLFSRSYALLSPTPHYPNPADASQTIHTNLTYSIKGPPGQYTVELWGDALGKPVREDTFKLAKGATITRTWYSLVSKLTRVDPSSNVTIETTYKAEIIYNDQEGQPLFTNEFNFGTNQQASLSIGYVSPLKPATTTSSNIHWQ